MTDDEIRDLCTRLRAGEPEAQRDMFLYLADKLRPLAHKFLRVDFPRLGLQAETEDILHDVLCKLVPYLKEKGEAFCSGTEMFHRLTGTALRRSLIDLIRKHGRSLGAPSIDDLDIARNPQLWKSSGLEAWRTALSVHELIDKLDEADRHVIELSEYASLTNVELAKCLGIAEGNASRRMSKAKEHLGRLILEDERKTN